MHGYRGRGDEASDTPRSSNGSGITYHNAYMYIAFHEREGEKERERKKERESWKERRRKKEKEKGEGKGEGRRKRRRRRKEEARQKQTDKGTVHIESTRLKGSLSRHTTHTLPS